MTRAGSVLLLALLSLAACTGGRDSRVRIAKLDRKGRAPRQVWVVGHGSDTLVALAGGPGLPGEYLAAALASLGTRHTIVIWEAPGSGLRVADPVQPSGLTADSLADDVDRLLDALGLERASLVAHDFGALVAARHSMRHPGRATRLALLAPAPLRHVYHVAMRLRPPDSVAMTTLMRLIADSVPARDPARFCRMAWPFYLAPYVERDSAVVRELRATLCRADEAALRAIAPIREGAYHALPNWEWRDSLRALRVPTLVIAGTRDTLLQHAGRSWAGYLPSALLVEVDASPLAPWVEWPSLLSGALAPFLDERSVAGGRRPTLAEIAAPGDTVPPPGIDSAVYRATLDSLARRDASASHR